MKKSMTWNVLGKLSQKTFSIDELIALLLKNRNIVDKKSFLKPDITQINAKRVGIDGKMLQKAIARINKAKKENEQIVVYGDYDVDGITGTAILWEALNEFGAKVMPFIPSRVEEGYGLSIKGIEHILTDYPDTKIIITVDNGIVANTAVDFANAKGIDVIITDHHTIGAKLPEAHAIVHTTKLCGAGVGWMLGREFEKKIKDHLALVALATVADLVPLTDANRTVLIEGLKILHTTQRLGIVALCEDAKIDQEKIGVYEIGHMLAPRLNAMGRISHAMESLRLLCTKDRLKAKVLAEKHGLTNKDRQFLTETLSEKAIVFSQQNKNNILFVAHEEYDEGVIGLVAGKLVEKYYRPSIVIAKKEKVSKASARSIPGFNIIEFIRSGSHLLINAGGHPMAAGFTIATENIDKFEKFVAENALAFDKTLLEKKIKIDCELSLEFVSQKVYDAIQQLAPFGMGNPEPTFVARAKILSAKQVGKEKNHLSLQVNPVILGNKVTPESKGHRSWTRQDDNGRNGLTLSAIAFGMGERLPDFAAGKEVEIVYTIDENEWNNKKTLQLKIRDIR